MEFLTHEDFFSSLPTDLLRGDIKLEDIEIDEELSTAFNPDDFLNESFFKTENETPRIKSHSESSFSENTAYSPPPLQLTPPISPQPIIIPITQIHSHNNNSIIMKIRQCSERKIKPILPAITNKSHAASGSSDSDSRSSSNMGVVDKALIKQARIIRNRESALQSRRKKKEYLQNLEVEVGDLRKEVKLLKEENCHLKSKLQAYSSFTCRCASSLSSKVSTKNASLMCALLLMMGFNLIPLGNYLTTQSTSISDMRGSSISSRHLLFVENNVTASGDESSSSEIENEKEDFIPLYFNQTDRVRKANIENVLNWIPQPELFNVTNVFDSNKFDNENFEDPLQYKLSKMYEKSKIDQARKEPSKKSLKKRLPKKKKVDDENLYNPDNFKFLEFFDEIKRRDDTFYVLSFKSDHLLLPAIENFSQMIKMNLIMPRSDSNDTLSSDKIMMMQIETIVLNTSLIEVTEKSIPMELVKTNSTATASIACNQQKINSTENAESLRNVTKSPENNLLPKRRKFAPYFHFDLSRK